MLRIIGLTVVGESEVAHILFYAALLGDICFRGAKIIRLIHNSEDKLLLILPIFRLNARYYHNDVCFEAVQFPYWSPNTRLSNDDISPFESFSFTLIRLLSFTCPLYSFGLSFGVVRLVKVENRSDRFTCSRLSLIEHMTVDRSRGSYRRVT